MWLLISGPYTHRVHPIHSLIILSSTDALRVWFDNNALRTELKKKTHEGNVRNTLFLRTFANQFTPSIPCKHLYEEAVWSSRLAGQIECSLAIWLSAAVALNEFSSLGTTSANGSSHASPCSLKFVFLEQWERIDLVESFFLTVRATLVKSN